MNTKRLMGLKVITNFRYRGANVYIRGRQRFFEQLIVHKNKLFTHYFEAPPETAGRVLYEDEKMNMVGTIMDIAKATVDDIIQQRSPLTKIKNYVLSTKAAKLFAQPGEKDGEPEQAEASRPAIQVPIQARGNEAKV